MADPPASRAASIAAGAVAVACAVLVLIATRSGLRMSPDSITYLAVADHLRHGRGLTDFTGDQLTVFGPIQPLLLAPGGRSVMWARLVSATGIGVAAFLQYVLLRGSTRAWVAVGAAAVLGAGECLLLVAASAYSEVPYIVFSLALFVVLMSQVTVTRCAVAGSLAAVGFLARYAGASLVVTGLVVVVFAVSGATRPERRRCVVAYLATAGALSAAWIVHNLVVSGQPLGPRFEGGTDDRWDVLLRRPFAALGETLLGDSLSTEAATAVGAIAMIVIAVAGAVWVRRGTVDAIRAGMLVYAATNFVLPMVARAATSNDISSRVMSPMLIPLVYIGALAVDSFARVRAVVVIVGAAGVAWIWQGIAMVERVPQLPSSGDRAAYSEQLHDLIDELPADAQVLTNNPWGVWWQNRREPTLFAFTRPRPGNSHFPISGERTLHLACTVPTYLAWFPDLMNAGDGPVERRSDLLEVIQLHLQDDLPGGQLYLVQPREPGECADYRSMTDS